jgi:hypothetical protein
MNPELATKTYAEFGIWGIIVLLIVAYSGFQMWFITDMSNKHRKEREDFKKEYVGSLKLLTDRIENGFAKLETHEQNSIQFRASMLSSMNNLNEAIKQLTMYITMRVFSEDCKK